MGMKTVWKLSGVLAMSFVLGGCSSMGLSDSPAPQAPVVQTGNNLALPPDLQLRPPGTVTENYQPNPAPAPAAPVQTAALDDGLNSSPPVAAAPVKRDIYAEYGISKTKPDGTPKLEGDLKAELKQAILKRKQQQNPGYGTIRNIGNIFSDG
jgi:pyruvate/2-oxoglutarate dehydrogenase complex dihydrolipoamide acyltransferase (E2) component